MKIDREIGGGVVFVLLSMAIWFLIPFQIEIKTETVINARFVPQVIAISLFVFSVINLVLQILQKAKGESKEVEFDESNVQGHGHGHALLMVLVLVLYLVIMDLIGFELSSILVSWAILILIGSRNWKYYVISGVFSVVVGLIFRYLFNVNLS
jgi:putative tricarboxylic transport membrane protein